MAQEALKKLEEHLDCAICLDTFTDPKQLQCNHIYCQQCLRKLVFKDQQGQLILTCPNCRQITPVPANGVTGLQPAFHINRLLEIQSFLKKIKAIPTSPENEVSASPLKTLPYCTLHSKKESELYCVTCEELICAHCALKDGQHHTHDYKLLDEATEAIKKEVELSLNPVEALLAAVRDSLSDLDSRSCEITDQQASIETSIRDDFQKIHAILDSREKVLIKELCDLTQGKLTALAVQRDQLETTLAQLRGCLESMRESLISSSQDEVLMMKTNIVKEVKELISTFQPDVLTPVMVADIAFSTTADTSASIVSLCEHFGEVLALGVLDPSKCHVTGDVAVAKVKELTTLTVHAVNFQGQPYQEPIESLECEFVSSITGTKTKCIVDPFQRSQYKISYLPAIKGRHQLHVKLEGQHIRGSPFNVAVKSHISEISAPVLTIDGVEKPLGLAVNQRGEVVVTEGGKDCVSVFSPSGEKLRSFGTSGSGSGELRSPHGVAVTNNCEILVADSYNHRIQKFGANGEFLAVVGSNGTNPLQFNSPGGVAYNADFSKIYVVDENHRVQALNSDLTFSHSFGREGNGRGQFSYPSGVACDSSGSVYVADRYNHRIQVFTADGRFLRQFGKRGEGGEKLNFPICVAIDTDDMVYVSDCNNHRISVFTAEGQFLTSFGKKGKKCGEFRYPNGVFVDASGVVYVCDWMNMRVQAF